jgi:hypothetical protein
MAAPDPVSMITVSAEQLEASLPDPVPVKKAAEVLGISAATAYAMCHRFIAAKLHGDVAGMRDAIPCIKPGPSRYVIPRAAFVAFYTSAGLSRELLAELYGPAVAADLLGEPEREAS